VRYRLDLQCIVEVWIQILEYSWACTYTGRVSTITLITVDALANDLAVDVSVFS
jgi:hypothetical protein